jgi:hypothetical protein
MGENKLGCVIEITNQVTDRAILPWMLVSNDDRSMLEERNERIEQEPTENDTSIVSPFLSTAISDFSSMDFLDNANKPHQRDIAQFVVQFNKHQTSSADLTSETLREIPDQPACWLLSAQWHPAAAAYCSER